MVAGDVGDLWIDTDDNNKLYRYSGTAWVAVQDTHNDALVSSHSTAISSLNTAISAKTTIFYQTSQPTATATGDVWYDTDANPVTIMRWSGSAWEDITTTALSQALTAAAGAQATADGKIYTYSQTTAPTGMVAGDVGDLWIDTDDNNKLYRYSGTAWVAVQDTHLDSAVSTHSSQITQNTQQIELRVDKTTYYTNVPIYLSTDPSLSWTAQQKIDNVGYLWYQISSGITWRWNGLAWINTTPIDGYTDPSLGWSSEEKLANIGYLWGDKNGESVLNKQWTGTDWTTTLTSNNTSWSQAASSQIIQTADSISTKVSKDSIISEINQSAEEISINASKINLSGYVTISSLGSGGSTTIDGSRITTGTVAASQIDVDNLYVRHLNGADGTFTGSMTTGYWTFDSNGSTYNTGNQAVLMQVWGGYARYTTWNLSALYGSTSYNETRVYGGAVVLDCASTGQSASARSGYWGSYSYSDVCFVCDQAGSSYDSARGNLGTTDNRWDILWCDTVHYRTRASDSCRDVKHDILPLPDYGSVIDQLAPVSFKYNDDKTQRTRYGLIYEDTIDLMPDICVETQEGDHTFKGISYEDLIAVLLGEVKRLRQRVASLETSPKQAQESRKKEKELESRIKELEKKNEEYEERLFKLETFIKGFV